MVARGLYDCIRDLLKVTCPPGSPIQRLQLMAVHSTLRVFLIVLIDSLGARPDFFKQRFDRPVMLQNRTEILRPLQEQMSIALPCDSKSTKYL